MAKKFYIAGMHFSHEHILSFDNRPFVDTKSMDAVMIKRLNDAVGKGDLVYVLGNMFWCHIEQSMQIIRGLSSRKFLLLDTMTFVM